VIEKTIRFHQSQSRQKHRFWLLYMAEAVSRQVLSPLLHVPNRRYQVVTKTTGFGQFRINWLFVIR
jgi:hypothetical protein